MALLPWTGVDAQRTAGTALVVRVNPEARVDPSSIALRLVASEQGSTTQTTAVTAWVRATPGSAIHLQASLTNLSGPAGSLQPGAITWTGAATQSTGGGRDASCAAGSFTAASAQDLAQGWARSGTLVCTLTFQLAPGAAPGVYSGTVEFSTQSN